MRAPTNIRHLALLLLLGLALPAGAEEREEVTDELPDWMEAELEDARAWADADPYVAAGVYVRVEVRPFRRVLP